MPKVYEALTVDEAGLTLEVQQQLGDGVVRTIAMGASEGIKRGMAASATGAPISVPVGKATLGRIMDVLGNPIDEAGPSVKRRVPPSTARHLPMRSCRPAPSCWKPASRLSTWFARSPRVVRSVCSVVPV